MHSSRWPAPDCSSRSSGAARSLVLALAVDLAPYVLLVGYANRYGYLAFGLFALGRALGFERRTRWALTLVPVLGLAWALDTVRDVVTQRDAGRIVENVIEASGDARQLDGPTCWIALVDLPEVGGREEDITLMNWGTREALVRAGIGGPFALLRTTPARSSTKVEYLEPAALERFVAEKDVYVLRFEPSLLGVVPRE